MSSIFDAALSAITSEENTEAEVDELVEKARTQWAEIDKRYRALRGKQFAGEGMQTVMAMIRKYAPGLATKFGYPGIAAALVAGTADDGAFSGITSIFGKIFGFFGLG